MNRQGPDWLAELERRFGETIRTPLDRTNGTLTATLSMYDERIAAECGAERLAVYNRQYWFRLLEVVQDAFPLTMRLFGAWAFNEHAARFLAEHPPRSWDIDHAPDGFERFLDEVLENAAPDRLAFIEAARIDAAWKKVFCAPATSPFYPSASDAAGLLDSRLVLSPAVATVEEHFALSELRKVIFRERGESRVEVPPRLKTSQSWALLRRDEGTLQIPLEPREAQLIALLATSSIRDALARLEQTCSEEERAALPAKTNAWLARSVKLGFWIHK